MFSISSKKKLFCFSSSLHTYMMVQKWKLCIEVSCHPNPGKASISYVIYNMDSRQVLRRERDVCGRTTNNKAYYIALIEGLKSAKQLGANDISVFTNSELICKQMEGVYQVKKDNLKPLHREARIMVSQFNCFTINYHANIKRMSSDLLFGGMSTLGGVVKDELTSTSIPSKFIDGHCHSCYRYPICGCFLVIIVFVSFMVWFFQ